MASRKSAFALHLLTAVLFSGAALGQAANNGGNNNNNNANQPAAASQAPAVTITGVPTATTNKASSPSTITGLSNLPTLAGATVPTAVVPDTAAAPYMQKSSVPEGTVFICVGALLGFLLLSVLMWRMVGWYLIHRSVRRANERLGYGEMKSAQGMSATSGRETKKLVSSKVTSASGKGSSAEAKRNTKYTSLAAPSTLSLEHLNFSTPTGNGKRNTSRQTYMSSTSGTQRPSSLFFSPTAAGSSAGARPGSGAEAGNRSSTYLPSGHYATPGASAAGGASSMQLGQSRNPSAGLSGLGRYSLSAYNMYTPTPPDSPGLPPPSRGERGTASPSRPVPPYAHGSGYDHGSRPSSAGYGSQQSRINLHAPGNLQPGGRVPSTNLEGLLEGQFDRQERYRD
jgi:hypothetical protein